MHAQLIYVIKSTREGWGGDGVVKYLPQKITIFWVGECPPQPPKKNFF